MRHKDLVFTLGAATEHPDGRSRLILRESVAYKDTKDDSGVVSEIQTKAVSLRFAMAYRVSAPSAKIEE